MEHLNIPTDETDWINFDSASEFSQNNKQATASVDDIGRSDKEDNENRKM